MINIYINLHFMDYFPFYIYCRFPFLEILFLQYFKIEYLMNKRRMPHDSKYVLLMNAPTIYMKRKVIREV